MLFRRGEPAENARGAEGRIDDVVRPPENKKINQKKIIEFAEFVRHHKMRCSYTHHQMRDLLAISPLNPHTLYTLSRGNIVSYNLLTHKVTYLQSITTPLELEMKELYFAILLRAYLLT